MERVKKAISVFIAAAMLLALLPTGIIVSAETVSSGVCGDNLTWTLDEAGVLTISGTGDMYSPYDSEFEEYDRESISAIVIESGATNIGASAFADCCNLISVVLPDSITTIGNHAFFQCGSLVEISIPHGVTIIEDSAFSNCGITEITIPDSVEELGWGVFEYCENLESITIGSGVVNIQVCLLKCCRNLQSITVSEDNPYYYSIGNCIIETETKTLIAGCANSVIPDDGSVTIIGSEAFEGCYGFASIVIPEGVTIIEEMAFFDCAELTDITLPVSVTNIGEDAFDSCPNLVLYVINESYSHSYAIAVGLSYEIIKGNVTSIEVTTLPIKTTYIEGKGTLDVTGGIITVYYDNGVSEEVNMTGDMVSGFDNTTVGQQTLTVIYKEITTTFTVTIIASTIIDSGVCGENLTWVLEEDGVLIISGTGDMNSFRRNGPWGTDIKSAIIISGVTSIGARAFSSCASLVNVTIPDSVTKIGDSAFSSCSALSSLIIPNSVTDIGNDTFSNCHALTMVIMPDSATSIGTGVFNSCESLTRISIPNGVTSIGNRAFYGCNKLSSIVLPENIEIIGDWAFAFSGLTSVSIPKSIISIGASAFWNCSKLKELFIANGVTSIGDEAFYNCNGLNSIRIPTSVTCIGNKAFVMNYAGNQWGKYRSLCSIVVDEGNPVYRSAGNCLIETATRTLLTGCENSVIPNDGSVTVISDCAFEACGLEYVEIPDSVEVIGINAFCGCGKLTCVIIPESVQSIGEGAFDDCSNVTLYVVNGSYSHSYAIITELAYVIIHGNVISIGITALPNKITYTEGNSEFDAAGGKVMVYYYDGTSEEIDMTDDMISGFDNTVVGRQMLTVTYGDKTAMFEIEILKKVIISIAVTTLPYKTIYTIAEGSIDVSGGKITLYYDNGVSEEIDMTDNMVSGFDNATVGQQILTVTYCGLMTTFAIVTIASIIVDCGACGANLTWALDVDGVLTINGIGDMYNNYDGYDRESVIAIKIGPGVTCIGDWAFAYCTALTSVEFPDSITSIGNQGFIGCSILERILLPEGIIELGDYAFCDCYNLQEISIPNNLTRIGSFAFANCSGLKEIKIGKGLIRLGDGVFDSCGTNLEAISVDANNPIYHSSGNCLIETESKTIIQGCKNSVIPVDGSVVVIGERAFSACVDLVEILIPWSIERINDRAFDGCRELRSIIVDDNNRVYHSEGNCLIETELKRLVLGCKSSDIPSNGSVTEIGTHAFDGSGIKSIVIPFGITSICEGAFSSCYDLLSITMPSSIVSIGGAAFVDCWNLNEITIPESVKSIGTNAFEITGYYNEPSNWEGKALYIGKWLLCVDYEISGKFKIKDGIEYIADGAFFNREGLTEVVIPNSVKSIGKHAFFACFALENIEIPSSVIHIDDLAFLECTRLKSITIGVESVVKSCGMGAKSESNGVMTIGEGILAGCNSLQNVKVSDDNPTYHSSGNCIIETETKTLIAGCANSIIPEDGSVTSIGPKAFANCTELKSITIPAYITSIGEGAFNMLDDKREPAGHLAVELIVYKDSYALDYAIENGFQYETIPLKVVSITVIALPDKIKYHKGEEFDTAGLEITASYDNGTSAPVTDYELSGYSGEIGENNITVSYGDTTCGFVVTVINMKGDIDGDDEITVSDALAALRAAVGLVGLEGDALAVADIDGDGVITVSDALHMLRIAAKLSI